MCVYVHIYAYINVMVKQYLQTQNKMNTHAYICTYVHTYIQNHICRPAIVYIKDNTGCYYMHACIYTYIHTHIHTYIHVQSGNNDNKVIGGRGLIHTYIHTYIHT